MKFFKLSIFIIIVISALFIYEILRNKITDLIFDKDEINHQTLANYSQFVEINSLDEFILAELVTQETFYKSDFQKIFGRLVVGESNATLSAVATFKYYSKLSETVLSFKDSTLIIEIPHLYLSLPVAFDTQTLFEKGTHSLFGKNKDELIAELRNEITQSLMIKGKAQKSSIKEKAAKSMADNFHSFMLNNSSLANYKFIIVKIAKEEYAFPYRLGLCGQSPCRYEFELWNDKIFTLP